MLKKLSEMIETRKIIALSVILTVCYLALRGTIDSKDFMMLSSNIVVFYFGFKKENSNDNTNS